MKGFTLIEILITVFLSVIVATIIVASIVLGGRIYEDGREKIELIQNGRVVLNVLTREIRQAERIVTSLPDSEVSASEEIIFEDGHLEYVKEDGYIQEGDSRSIVLPNESSDEDGFYKNMYIKIIGGSPELKGEVRKIVAYNGDTKEAQLGFPLSEEDYFGLEYIIDTSAYYIKYYIEDNKIYRKVSAYYFSETPELYVSIEAVPPEGQTLEEDILEDRVIGEHFTSLLFWEDKGINILTGLKIKNKEIDLHTKISGRNL